MRLVEDKIAVEASKTSEQTRGGLYLAPTADAGQFISGKIVQLGPTTKEVHIGNLIHFNKFVASKITVNGVDFYILKESEVLLIED
jgi:co-chaperonin GroES (HSP10)